MLRWLTAALACATAACASGDLVRSDRLGAGDVRIVEKAVHGPYWLVHLANDRFDLRFLAPRSGACTALLDAESARYAREGFFGSLSRGDAICDLTGVASLARWRDRTTRAPGRPLPRATARFAEIHRDESFVLVRGRFPLLGRIGLPAGVDMVALLPNGEACQRPVERGEAALEFSDSSAWAYRLRSDTALCEVMGFALPAPPAQAAAVELSANRSAR